ncbi:MAG: hypothetical protein OEV00_05450, partial [Acidobacteriota bacterium]|nr:hypothetical protein [Acidobacteriota bacterium]
MTQKRLCWLIAFSLLLGQPLLASEAGGTVSSCAAAPARESRTSYPPLERIALDDPLESILADPGRVATMGNEPSSDVRQEGDVDSTGRWLPGYRPNTIQAWREFEAWKAEQRRIHAERGSMVPAALPGATGGVGTAPTSGRVPEDDDAPTAVRRARRSDVTSVDLRGLPSAAGHPDVRHTDERVKSADPRTGLPWDVYIRLKEDAAIAPETAGVQAADSAASRAPGFLQNSFEAIPGAGSVPPDPIMTAGASHLVALVNQRYRVWDKNGTPLINEIALADFFARVPDCDAPFDVFVDYDEENDRYVMGGMNIVGAATYLCVAATASHDPATIWNAYSFRADEMLPGTGIDYPHMAIGLDAVYIGGNMFDDGTGAFDSSRVFAVDKTAMYDGDPIQIAEFGVGAYRTPQPARIRGFHTGQWPAAGTPHPILAAQDGSGSVRVYRWTDPFVSNP